jgi:hypothetical protein
VGRIADLAAIALGLVGAGAAMAAPGLTIEQRAGALSAIAAGLILLGRLSGRRHS